MLLPSVRKRSLTMKARPCTYVAWGRVCVHVHVCMSRRGMCACCARMALMKKAEVNSGLINQKTGAYRSGARRSLRTTPVLEPLSGGTVGASGGEAAVLEDAAPSSVNLCVWVSVRRFEERDPLLLMT